ncbi:hypothetical protein FBU59_005417 [Linderina macrospora]|uniref:Uncharacterized protein n=1 Tax=Linderina macrospora TaxID=4868 RepID=A0ACC1J2W1_9FUNG|nr:hypothetical protein FBU59_005417 [Linderina macrospora]
MFLRQIIRGSQMRALGKGVAQTAGAAQPPHAIVRACMTAAAKPPVLNAAEEEYPPTYTQSHIAQTQHLADQRQGLGIVQQLLGSEKTVRTAFYWPFGKRKIAQAAETLIYGALAGPGELPLLPLIFRWKQIPDHIAHKATEADGRGLTVVQYLGSRLNLGNGSAANPGILFVLLDDLTARTSLLAAPEGMTTFTANFELDYKRQIEPERFLLMDAWVTRVEGRKVFIEARAADAESGEAIVEGRALFVAVPVKK